MFRNLIAATFIALVAIASSSTAQAQHHSKHNMLLFGTDEIFADHIVYKVPHNYQVIVRVHFDEETKNAYLSALWDHPSDTLIFLLDSMDISAIESATGLNGTLLRRGEAGQETIKAGVTLTKEQFQVVYFSELPLALAGNHPSGH